MLRRPRESSWRVLNWFRRRRYRQEILRSIEALREEDWEEDFLTPYELYRLAYLHAELCDYQTALQCLDDVLECKDADEETRSLTHLHRAALLQKLGSSDGIEVHLIQARRISRHHSVHFADRMIIFFASALYYGKLSNRRKALRCCRLGMAIANAGYRHTEWVRRFEELHKTLVRA